MQFEELGTSIVSRKCVAFSLVGRSFSSDRNALQTQGFYPLRNP